jgi:hypothetical protein
MGQCSRAAACASGVPQNSTNAPAGVRRHFGALAHGDAPDARWRPAPLSLGGVREAGRATAHVPRVNELDQVMSGASSAPYMSGVLRTVRGIRRPKREVEPLWIVHLNRLAAEVTPVDHLEVVGHGRGVYAEGAYTDTRRRSA